MANSSKLARAIESENIKVTEKYDNDSLYKQSTAVVHVRVYAVNKFLSAIGFLLAEQERMDNEGEEYNWSVKVTREYKSSNGKLGYFWKLMVLGDEDRINDGVKEVARLLELVKRFEVTPLSKSNGGDKPVRVTPPGNSARGVKADAVIYNEPRNLVGGVMVDGEVVSMPLVGVDENRNKPKAPMLTPGMSSKGAHLIVPKREKF